MPIGVSLTCLIRPLFGLFFDIFKQVLSKNLQILIFCLREMAEGPSNYLSCSCPDTLFSYLWGALLGYTPVANLINILRL